LIYSIDFSENKEIFIGNVNARTVDASRRIVPIMPALS
jgi:hypothetical protein